jgi:hypothetical protein
MAHMLLPDIQHLRQSAVAFLQNRILQTWKPVPHRLLPNFSGLSVASQLSDSQNITSNAHKGKACTQSCTDCSPSLLSLTHHSHYSQAHVPARGPPQQQSAPSFSLLADMAITPAPHLANLNLHCHLFVCQVALTTPIIRQPTMGF